MRRLYDLASPSATRLRHMYATGRANPTARRLAHLWAWCFARGLMGRRWVTLEVTGRRSGQPRRFPLGMADVDGQDHLVSMLGECAWTRNVRAAHGDAALLHGRRRRVRLVEVPVAERAPIIKGYLQQVPGGRPHIPVDPEAPVAAFEVVAPRIPVFRVEDAPTPA